MKKVAFGGLTFDRDASFGYFYFDIFVDNKYIGFAEEFHNNLVFWRLFDTGKNFVGGHIGRYIDSVEYDSLDELRNDLETQEEDK